MASRPESSSPLAEAIARRVNGERLVLLGWSRAILLQMAHPLVAAGVAAHSSFRASPMASARRLHQTVRAMLSLTFGTQAEQQQTLENIRAIHRRVRGGLADAVGPYPAGTPYSAEDPVLVLWVHVTIVESSILAYESLVARLTPHERDEYCRTAAGVAIALGAREAEVPASWESLTNAVAATVASGALHVGPDARAIAAAVLRSGLATAVAPAAWLNRRVTASWLPPEIRAAYGIPWTARHARQCDRAIRGCRAFRRRMPERLARWSHARAGQR